MRWEALSWMAHFSSHRGYLFKLCKYANLPLLRQRLTAWRSMKHHSVFRTKAEISAHYFSPCPGSRRVAMSGNPKHSTVRFWRLNLIAHASAITILWFHSGIPLIVKYIVYSSYLTNARCKFFTINANSRSHAISRCGLSISARYNGAHIEHIRS